jgi:hypothetical protein
MSTRHKHASTKTPTLKASAGAVLRPAVTKK